MQIRAYRTPYGGYIFRSRLEARWAVLQDALGIDWTFEPEGYESTEALRPGGYLPDFESSFNRRKLILEIKRVNEPQPNAWYEAMYRQISASTNRLFYLVRGLPTARVHQSFPELLIRNAQPNPREIRGAAWKLGRIMQQEWRTTRALEIPGWDYHPRDYTMTPYTALPGRYDDPDPLYFERLYVSHGDSQLGLLRDGDEYGGDDSPHVVLVTAVALANASFAGL